MGSEQPKDLSPDLISGVIQRYKSESLFRVHNRIREMGVLKGFKEKIAELIREEVAASSLTDP